VTDAVQTQYNSRLANHPRPAIILTVVGYLLLGFLERLPGTFIPPLLYFLVLGFVALFLMPRVLGLPNGRKPLRDYCRDIRLLPVTPLARNILLGLLLAALTLSSILVASLLTGHFTLDWSTVPLLRWVKGLTRGIWEEVFFRGIILVLFLRIYPRRQAIILSTLVFALAHLRADLSLEMIVDLVSIFFMGLLFTYLALKTGSLLPGIIFHYVHDGFLLLVQNTPGADEIVSSALLFGFLWTALIIGALVTKVIVERWPSSPSGAET
jgi:membrane protease YdiL (CAAX protease family)